jgi:hypothetical protein
MDPDENLREQRELRATICGRRDRNEPVPDHEIERFCDVVEALDDWISTGGFLPDAWARGLKLVGPATDPCADNACGGPPDCNCMCHDPEAGFDA